VTIAVSALTIAASRLAPNPNAIRPRGVTGDRSAGDDVERQLGRHRGLDGGAAHLAVALRGMAVAEVHQRPGHGDRQEQRRARGQVTAVDVPSTGGPGRDRGVLARLVRRHPDHPEERRDPHGAAAVVGRGPGVGVDLPEQPGGRTGEPERAVQRGVPGARGGPPPVTRGGRHDVDREHVPRFRAAHRDQTGEAVPAPRVEHPGPLLPRCALPFEVPGRIE
jgi:hypothetical protein